MKTALFIVGIVLSMLFIGCNETTNKNPDGNLCDDLDCGSNGTCIVVEAEGYAMCDCNAGYTFVSGSGCINPCEGERCKPHGVCIADGATARCSCNDGYYAINLECRQETDLCKDVICDGGICNQDNGECECDSGYHLVNGTKCEINQGCDSPTADCGEHGICIDDIEGDFWCECDNGYYYNGTTCAREFCANGVPCGTNCCSGSQICFNGSQCMQPGRSCENDFECDTNQFCDSVMGLCLEISTTDGSCQYIPEFQQQMTPLVAWSWNGSQTNILSTHKHVLMPPVVGNITDDNNDGVVNLKDIPDIAFTSYPDDKWDTDSVLRVLSGDTGREHFTITTPKMSGGSGLALGDIDNDGFNEIVGIKVGNKRVVAFDRNGNLKWETQEDMPRTAPGAPAIADLDHDGKPEIIVGNYIFNGDNGSKKCNSTDILGSYGNNSDYPTNAHKRYITVVEDINNDGVMDIVTGNLIISGRDCSRIWAREDRKDGYTAIADLNWDGNPEIVVVSNGYLYIYDFKGEDLITPFPIDNAIGTSYPIGGPPTVANFDDDISNLEIAVAGTEYYRVLKPNLSTGIVTVLWEKATKDYSSRQTGSSLFDFEGDGKAEVLYADECYFRIYDGLRGSERFKIKNSSATIFEYPLVVDINGDGKSEVVVVANASYSTNKCPWGPNGAEQDHISNGNYGIRVFEDSNNNWVRTRTIWNQHSYHITNVSETGKIPQVEEKNWLNYNNYRLNSQGKGVFNAPNFIVERVQVEREDCPQLSFKIKVRVANLGTISVKAGVPIAIYKGLPDQGSRELIGFAVTQTDLWPGRREIIEFDYTPENPDEIRRYNIFASADDYGNGIGAYSECNESDNIMETSFKGSYGMFCNTGVGQCMRFAPYICNESGELVCGAVAGAPQTEVCGDGLDNNCNGETDENCGCNSGETQECYRGYADSFGENSRCKKGTQSCIGGELWTSCENDILPMVETCNGIDDDCDGIVDDGFQIGQSCVVGLGACRKTGVYSCDSSGNQTCDATPGEPQDEICGDSIDNDCDGLVDERPCRE
ncbi:VCBS repeat-containing protein [bacterium]|nr:VCBS repeat-containing protein [bacterium]